MDLCYLFIRLRDRIDDLIEIKGYLLTVSLDNLCFYITIHSFSLIYIKLQDSVCFHFLAQNLVVVLPISTISCAIAFYYITLFFIKKKELIFHFREYEDVQTES